MQPFICGKYIDKYLIASRSSRRGLIISEKAYYRILESSQQDLKIAPWVVELLSQLETNIKPEQKINEVLSVRLPTNFNFGRASYEITESCNYKCKHCYLGQKKKDTLSVLDKKNILQLIRDSGCLWLQITGGDPLFDENFVEIYSFAYSLGFLITISTNGSMLIEPKILNVLKSYPPYRLTISAYGATAYSYESLTGIPGSFQTFALSLKLISETSIRTRINIIVTTYNQNEVAEMIELAKNFRYEYYIFKTITPTIDGNISTTKMMAHDYQILEQCNELESKEYYYKACEAGKSSFNVDSHGMMSICKVVRVPNINLLKEGIVGFDKLMNITEELNRKPSFCSFCEFRKNCVTCPHVLKLYLKTSKVSTLVCKNYDSFSKYHENISESLHT